MVKEIESEAQFYSEVAGPQLTVVDFFATWCGPCTSIAPFVQQLSEKYRQVKFLKVDVDKCQGIAKSQRVTAMPTFLFMKGGVEVYRQQGANPASLEAQVVAHKVETDPFSGSKGHSLSSTPSVPYENARAARLAAFGHMDTKKAPSVSEVKPKSSQQEDSMNEDEEAEIAKAIALSVAETSESTATSASSTEKADKSVLRAGDEKEDDLVPVPVNMEILSQLIDMGFTDVRGRKAIIHGQSLEGALAWLDEHQNDPDIDQAYLVKREDAERRDGNGDLKPLSEEEKAQKIKEMQEKIKRLREEKIRKAKEDEIIREKERRSRGKKIDTISEEREKILKKLEMDRAKKEKEDAKKERERLLAELARDKEIRKRNAGVLPSVLGVDGYNPSAIQYNQKVETSTDASTSPAASATEARTIEKKSDEPVVKKQASGSKTVIDHSTPPEQRIDAAIQLIMKYKLGGDGGNALKLLITFLKNISEHPGEAKYQSINMESNAYKTKLASLVGPFNLLVAVGFEKVNEDGVDKLKYTNTSDGSLLVSTLAKLVRAEGEYQRIR